MVYDDDSHEFVRQVKEIEERVQDLESKNRTQITPNPLITVDDTYRYSDDPDVRAITASAGRWDETQWALSQWDYP